LFTCAGSTGRPDPVYLCGRLYESAGASHESTEDRPRVQPSRSACGRRMPYRFSLVTSVLREMFSIRAAVVWFPAQ